MAAENQSFAEGVLAYKNGHFSLAVDLLQSAVRSDQYDWNARFYLAMALARNDQPKEAKFHFMNVRDLCPDANMRQRAASALVALNTCEQKAN